MVIYMTSKLLFIYCIQTKPNLDSHACLQYNLVGKFLYSSYRRSHYFAESDNTLTILFSKIGVIKNKIKNDRWNMYVHQFLSMNCILNFIVIPKETRRHFQRQETYKMSRYDISGQYREGWKMQIFQGFAPTLTPLLEGDLQCFPGPPEAFFAYLSTLGRLSGQLPSPKPNSVLVLAPVNL